MDSSPGTKPRRRPSRSAVRKYFTLEHANRALPLVRRIASDIVVRYEAVAKIQAVLAREGGDAVATHRRELEDECNRGVEKLRDLARELSDIGVELKDWQRGLIDFPTLREDREVFLCWQLGEERVEYWHDADTGFAGRQPVDASF